jgi:hypothetical protein
MLCCDGWFVWMISRCCRGQHHDHDEDDGDEGTHNMGA